MEMPKHTDEAKAHFRSLISEAPGVEVRPMFGAVAAFVNGNMFAGLFGEDIGVKLEASDEAELKDAEGSGPFGPAERPMNGWSAMPRTWTDEQAMGWIEKARDHVATFPPKVKKAAAKKKV